MKVINLITLLLFVSIEALSQSDSSKPGKVEDEKIYTIVEQQPAFPGGQESLARFLVKNLRYPKDSKVLEGKVFVQFIVHKDGSLTDITVVRGANKTMDDEALRVINLMPNWNPGRQNGQIVTSKYVLPLYFRSRK